MANNSNDAKNNAADLEAGYIPLADTPESGGEDSNMTDHLPPINSESSKKQEKAKAKAEKLRN